MEHILAGVVGICGATVVYAYAGYPLSLALLSLIRGRMENRSDQPAEWPSISIALPAYNEEHCIAETIGALLETDYPSHLRQILVISDGSTDRTVQIARQFESRGVDTLELTERAGKTAAENKAWPYLTGDIVVNTDASVRIDPLALKPLIASFTDPTVGVASGRDISVSRHGDARNKGESGYVGYEMWVRRLETHVGGIVGASGCFYAIRRELHSYTLPGALSRDFAAPLVAWEHGFRSVSVDNAVCYVPRTPSVRSEYVRKVRTMARGLATLAYKSHLLNPLRHGWFAWKLFSHKLARWMVPWSAALGLAALLAAAVTKPWALALTVPVGIVLALALLGWFSERAVMSSRLVSVATYGVTGLLAGLHAWKRALTREFNPTWEPTKRG